MKRHFISPLLILLPLLGHLATGCRSEDSLCEKSCEDKSSCGGLEFELECREACESDRDEADEVGCLDELDAVLECVAALELACDDPAQAMKIVESCSEQGSQLSFCEGPNSVDIGGGGASSFGTACSVNNPDCPEDLVCGAPEQEYCTQVNCADGEENEGVCPIEMECVPTLVGTPASVCVY